MSPKDVAQQGERGGRNGQKRKGWSWRHCLTVYYIAGITPIVFILYCRKFLNDNTEVKKKYVLLGLGCKFMYGSETSKYCCSKLVVKVILDGWRPYALVIRSLWQAGQVTLSP